jgi:hypothetical protein
MDLIWWFVLPFIWICLAFWPARVAARRGHSPAVFFIFSLFLFPLALILAYVLPRRGPPRYA